MTRRLAPLRAATLALLLAGMATVTAAQTGAAGTAPAASPSASPPPDLVVFNADVHTVDASAPRVQAFAVTAGRFSAVGTSAQVRALAGPKTRLVNARGHTLVPGFIDGHSHVTGNSRAVAGVDLAYIADPRDWLRRVRAAHDSLPPGAWIVGGGWDHTLRGDAPMPTRQMLDRAAPGRPVVLTHIDGHYSWASTRALALAGIGLKPPYPAVPAGGEIVRDAAGAPTGILLEGAQQLVRRLVPPRREAQRRAGLLQMQRLANRHGITGLHQMGALDDYLHLAETGQATLRVWYGQTGPDAAATQDPALLATAVRQITARRDEVAARVQASGFEAASGPLLRLGFVKLMNDGVLSAHTAVLLDDYADRPGWRGDYITSPAELNAQVAAVNAAGLPVAVHAIGDAAVRAALDAFEAARPQASAAGLALPNRIEHIELLAPADLPRFKALGVVASMQPNHATNSFAYLLQRIGAPREDRAYVWKSLLDAGVPLVFGADYGTSPLDPLVQIADAMFRTSPFGFLDGRPWRPEQALGFDQALRAYTQAGADMTPWKHEIGSITPGKWADFVLLDGTVPEPMHPRFRQLKVQQTWLAGRTVYARPR